MPNIERKLDRFSKSEVTIITDDSGARHIIQQPLALDLTKPLLNEDGTVCLDAEGKPKLPNRAAMVAMHEYTIDRAVEEVARREAEYVEMAQALGHVNHEPVQTTTAVTTAVPVQLSPCPDITECENCK